MHKYVKGLTVYLVVVEHDKENVMLDRCGGDLGCLICLGNSSKVGK